MKLLKIVVRGFSLVLHEKGRATKFGVKKFVILKANLNPKLEQN
jgi:hypothetical protein